MDYKELKAKGNIIKVEVEKNIVRIERKIYNINTGEQTPITDIYSKTDLEAKIAQAQKTIDNYKEILKEII